jgi:beta-lactamase superfamily II metal-dependent hydrolase
MIRDCTVLKLAHHGSRDGTDDRWLGLVRPRLAVASLGRGNAFGHPHPETLALLARWKIPSSGPT